MKVSFIGAGPGDPELLTRKAWRILGLSDIVLHDALIDVEGMKAAAPNAQWLDVGKRAGRVSASQEFISRTVVSLAKRGYKIARLKGGDPSIFGRLTEELRACKEHGIAFEIIPGVTAASASAAELGMSLTSRGLARSVVFLTPRLERGTRAGDSKWIDAARHADTAVLYMAGHDTSVVCQTLIDAGLRADTPACLVESASRRARTVQSSLAELASRTIPIPAGPTTMLIGEAFRESSAQAVEPLLPRRVRRP
jgi:uroporphyrin-III C-methyltransferase